MYFKLTWWQVNRIGNNRLSSPPRNHAVVVVFFLIHTCKARMWYGILIFACLCGFLSVNWSVSRLFTKRNALETSDQVQTFSMNTSKTLLLFFLPKKWPCGKTASSCGFPLIFSIVFGPKFWKFSKILNRDVIFVWKL